MFHIGQICPIVVCVRQCYQTLFCGKDTRLYHFSYEYYLDGIIDEPLQGGEGTNHHNPRSETLPYSGHTKFADDGTDCGGLVLEI